MSRGKFTAKILFLKETTRNKVRQKIRHQEMLNMNGKKIKVLFHLVFGGKYACHVEKEFFMNIVNNISDR